MSSEECSICGVDIGDKFCYELKCSHKFHYDCLMKTFMISSNKINHNSCPYCRQNTDLLPLVNGLKKVIPGIHCNHSTKEFILKKQELKENYSEPCKHILVRGKNKGNQCNKICLLGYENCKAHKKD